MSDELTERAVEIVETLKDVFPNATTALRYETPFQLLVATILAAQSTDKKVNEITPGLFRKYPTPAHFANADPRELEEDIHASGFFRQKARSIIEASQDIVNEHGGEVPDTIEELTKLRGVGRKTANVVLGYALGKPGIIVDTHMLRVAARLGLVDPVSAEKKNADKVERELMQVVPEKDWTLFSSFMYYLGQGICTARNPKCPTCPVLHLCPYGQAVVSGKKPA